MSYMRTVLDNRVIRDLQLDREQAGFTGPDLSDRFEYFKPDGYRVPSYRVPPSSKYRLYVDKLVMVDDIYRYYTEKQKTSDYIYTKCYICRTRKECELIIATEYQNIDKSKYRIWMEYRG